MSIDLVWLVCVVAGQRLSGVFGEGHPPYVSGDVAAPLVAPVFLGFKKSGTKSLTDTVFGSDRSTDTFCYPCRPQRTDPLGQVPTTAGLRHCSREELYVRYGVPGGRTATEACAPQIASFRPQLFVVLRDLSLIHI